ncbi:MAG: sugar ABC transporter permease [Bacillota bacterium]
MDNNEQNGIMYYLAKIVKGNGTLLALIGLGVILTFMTPSFFTPRNLTNLSRQTTIRGIIAVTMTMVILLAGIDLSVGSVVGLSAVTVTLLMQAGLGVWAAVLLTILICGVGIGMWNGFWIAKYDIHPFLITLGMMTIARGLAMVVTDGSSVPVRNNVFEVIGGGYIPIVPTVILLGIALVGSIYSIIRANQKKKEYGMEVNKFDTIFSMVMSVIGILFAAAVFGSYKGIPVPVAIFVVIIMIGIFILRNTKLGRAIYAIGGNEEASRLSGLNIFKVKMFVYTSNIVLASISGIILASRLNGANPNLGKMLELDVIASVAIGGTSFTGGYGRISGSIIGALIIGILNNGMSLLGINTFYQYIVKGLIIIFAVWYDTVSRKK